jgi:hypothetical protein
MICCAEEVHREIRKEFPERRSGEGFTGSLHRESSQGDQETRRPAKDFARDPGRLTVKSSDRDERAVPA